MPDTKNIIVKLWDKFYQPGNAFPKVHDPILLENIEQFILTELQALKEEKITKKEIYLRGLDDEAIEYIKESLK